MTTRDQTGTNDSDQNMAAGRKQLYTAPEKMDRSPETVNETKEAKLEWHRSAHYQLNQALEELRKALRGHAHVLTRSRNSSCVTDAEIHDALKHLIIGLKQPRWVQVLRIVAASLVTLGGVMIARGEVANDSTLILGGISISFILVALQELLLYFRR